MVELSFTVYGKPATAGSKRGFMNKKTGRFHIAPASQKQKPWMQMVSETARYHYSGDPLTCPFEYTFRFYFSRPKGHYGTGKNAGVVKASKIDERHTKKPDAIKLARAVEDALTGVIWRDDSQCIRVAIEKYYTTGQDRVDIKISSVDY